MMREFGTPEGSNLRPLIRSQSLRSGEPLAGGYAADGLPHRVTAPQSLAAEWFIADHAPNLRLGLGGPTGSVRAGSPIHTWPSRNRSAFQIGARALVSSIA